MKHANKIILKLIERAAVKSSESISWFFLYQPQIPKKLKNRNENISKV